MMNEVRREAQKRATYRGRLAKEIGQPRESCPSKESGQWSLAPFWHMGFDRATVRELAAEQKGAE